LAALQLLAPCRPGKIIGLWNNFRAAAEKNGWATPAEPLYFLKASSAACGHGQPVAVPPSYDGRVFYPRFPTSCQSLMAANSASA
jgi:2-keto-4-pentenoate hydratase/2-oxohepta-3-ene-1,7-dioic acid hydratase in catechol pathway